MIGEDEYEQNRIGSMSIRPYLIPLSATKVKLALVVYPVSKDQLTNDNQHAGKAAFPGLELTSFELDFFPVVKVDSDKTWGCPVIPLIKLGGSEDDFPHLPSTMDIKAKISSILRTAVKPDVKRDLRNLLQLWDTIQESGPSKLKEKRPDLLWPLWETGRGEQQGKGCFCCIYRRLGSEPVEVTY